MARANARSGDGADAAAAGGEGAPVENLTFEQAMEELEAIIDRIEQGAIGLEESLVQRRRGDALVKRCRDILDRAEQELKHVKPEEE
jgi:exodeoxyribonuclease VII small subunit